MRGKLLVIDGNDASGKHTQASLLIRRLRKRKQKAVLFDFPQYGSFFGQLVAKYLNGEFGNVNSLAPKLSSLIFALDRFDQMDKIGNYLKKGYYVVIDRYVESNLVYQSSKTKSKKEFDELIKWIIELEYHKLGILQPDFVLYLYVETSISKKLLKSRPDKSYINNKRKDIHESNLKYLGIVSKNYETLAKKFHWKRIECTKEGKILPKEEVSEIVYKAVKQRFFP